MRFRSLVALALVVAACGDGTGPGEDGAAPESASLSAGTQFSCALDRAGRGYCWGIDARGTLGDGVIGDSVATPRAVVGGHRFRQIAAGTTAACALTTNGEAYCWGDDTWGLLGGGGRSATPVRILGAPAFRWIGVGAGYACGLAADGRAWCWGRGTQLGRGDTTSSPTPAPVSATLSFRALSTGLITVCGVVEDGTTWCWGDNRYGATGGQPSTTTVVAPVSASGLPRLSTVHVGAASTCGRGTDGNGYCWGTDSFGTLGSGAVTNATSTTPVRLSVGPVSDVWPGAGNSIYAPTCALTTAGEAFCWGANTSGQLGAAASQSCTSQLLSFGCSGAPVRVSGGLRFATLTVGDEHVCGMTSERQIYCWGENSRGQLGTGAFADAATPTRVIGVE